MKATPAEVEEPWTDKSPPWILRVMKDEKETGLLEDEEDAESQTRSVTQSWRLQLTVDCRMLDVENDATHEHSDQINTTHTCVTFKYLTTRFKNTDKATLLGLDLQFQIAQASKIYVDMLTWCGVAKGYLLADEAGFGKVDHPAARLC